jgi:hypothetical protein
MGIIINMADRTWYYQKCTGVFSFTDFASVENKSFSLGSAGAISELSSSQRQCLETFLQSELSLFDQMPGRTDRVEHVIDAGSEKPVKQLYYPITPAIQEAINTEIDRKLVGGLIESSKSPWSSPIVMVRKPIGDYRLCIDFRKVNELSKRDSLSSSLHGCHLK